MNEFEWASQLRYYWTDSSLDLYVSMVTASIPYGWEYLGYTINIRCFTHDPSIKSSLKFLRRTPWARTKVENLYLDMLSKKR